MKYNIIFLDFDGVIVTQKSRFHKFDKDCVSLVKYIMEETDSHIVISSSWRYQTSLEQFRDMFKEYKIDRKRIIGLTPILKSRTRGQEISAWFIKAKEKIEINSYVILDDDSDMTNHLNYFVKTDTYKGISKDQALKAISILKGRSTSLVDMTERIWERFITKNFAGDKNFLGSIVKHKKLYMEAAKEIEEDIETDKKRMGAITFFADNYDFLSNFYEYEIKVDGIKYKTLEHAYQSLKTDDPDEREGVRDCPTPGKAKRAGKDVTLIKDWDTEKKFKVMKDLLRIKFSGRLKGNLIRTAPSDLVEGNFHHDNIWGACNCASCRGKKKQNNLGKQLVEVRQELMDDELKGE